jgi:hypothetical protein
MVARNLANCALHTRADREASPPTEGPGSFGKVPDGGSAASGEAVRCSRCQAALLGCFNPMLPVLWFPHNKACRVSKHHSFS